MVRYFPLEMPATISAVGSDLLGSSHEPPALCAKFDIADSNQYLEVRFESVLVFRVLDEMLLSTEGNSSQDGHLSDHLAYRTEDTVFGTSQSKLIGDIYPKAQEFLFVTGAGCLNVISEGKPAFRLMRKGDVSLG